MGGGGSTIGGEEEMTDFSKNSCDVLEPPRRKSDMYPNFDNGYYTMNNADEQIQGCRRHYAVIKPNISDDAVRSLMAADSVSNGSSSVSSFESQGVDALTTLNPSPAPLCSTPKRNEIKMVHDARLSNGSEQVGAPSFYCNGSHGDSGTEQPCPRFCDCDQNDSECEIIVTKCESIVSKKMLGPAAMRRSCSVPEEMLLHRTKHRPKWKIEVDMESTRVIHETLSRDSPVAESAISDWSTSNGDVRADTKDVSTETESERAIRSESEGEESRDDDRHPSYPSSENGLDDNKKKKHFWAKRIKRKNNMEKDKSSTMISENGANAKPRGFWPFNKANVPPHEITNPKKLMKLKQSLFEEKLKYLHIASRVNCYKMADVRATLLVETPKYKLTNAQLATKTYLLSVTLNAFFYPYPKTYVEWIESLSDIIQERLDSGDIIQKFGTSEIENCKVCLILSPDASVLLCNPNCSLIQDLANIAGYGIKKTFVMEASDEESQPPTSACPLPLTPPPREKFAPIYEIDEFEEEDAVFLNGSGVHML